jgi:putative endonuclease
MAEHNLLGKKGEDLAFEWLKENEFIILERNWRNRFEEIDIIAQKADELIIVEVKTRSSRAFGLPEDSVSLKKQRNLVNAAESYILSSDSDLDTRFDIISILISAGNVEITHIPYAFSPFD